MTDQPTAPRGLRDGFSGHGSHRPGSVCLECEREKAEAAASVPAAPLKKHTDVDLSKAADAMFHAGWDAGVAAPAAGLLREALDQAVNVLWGLRNHARHEEACRFARTFDGIEANNQPCDCGFDEAEDAFDSIIYKARTLLAATPSPDPEPLDWLHDVLNDEPKLEPPAAWSKGERRWYLEGWHKLRRDILTALSRREEPTDG